MQKGINKKWDSFMENVKFSQGFDVEDIDRVLVGRKREADGYVKAVEEGMKSILWLMDYMRIKKSMWNR